MSARELSDRLRERVWVGWWHSASAVSLFGAAACAEGQSRPTSGPSGHLLPKGEGSGLETQLPRVLPDLLDDPLRLGENLLISESENGPAESLQLGLPKMVPQDDIIPFVNAAVDLHDQPQPIAGEVGEVSADRVLAAEAVAVDLPAAEPLPKSTLRQTSGLTLRTRESCSMAGHDTTIDYFNERVSNPLPSGEGLSARERSDRLRERVWVGWRDSA